MFDFHFFTMIFTHTGDYPKSINSLISDTPEMEKGAGKAALCRNLD